MSKVDWSLAPKWADHVVRGPLIGFEYWASDDRRIQFGGDFDCRDDNQVKEGWDIVEEKPQSKPWSGPEDGLPPVGIKVDYMGDHCTVVAHVIERGQKGAILQGNEDWFYGTEATIDPIKTPEQLAAEQRETAIRELMDIAQVDCRVTAARLVDAGFKREVV